MLNFTDTGGLFDNFEVNREPIWPRFKWLIAQSAAWHALVITCVLLIPPVRNALSIAVIFSGGRFVDKPYNKTEIGDADITELTLEKFHYPEGYFAMDQQGMPNPTPQFLGSSFRSRSFKPLPVQSPSPTPAPSPTASPSSAIASNVEATGKDKGKGAVKPGEPAKTLEDQKKEDALQAERERVAKDAGIELPKEGEVNKQPFKDLAVVANDMKTKGNLDMNQPFEIVIETELDKQGKLVAPNVVRKAGDANLVELSKRLIEAMNDSGVLYYLKALSEDNPGSKVVFTIKQDGTSVFASVESEAKSPYSARILTKGFNAALEYGVRDRKGKVEEPLLRNTTASQDGNKIIFNFKMPRQSVIDLVSKSIVEASPTASP